MPSSRIIKTIPQPGLPLDIMRAVAASSRPVSLDEIKDKFLATTSSKTYLHEALSILKRSGFIRMRIIELTPKGRAALEAGAALERVRKAPES